MGKERHLVIDLLIPVVFTALMTALVMLAR